MNSLLEPEDPAGSGPAVSEQAIARAIEAWRARASYLPGEVLADPAWGMLLELLQAEVQDRRVSVARLCKVSGAPAAAAVRWLNALERHGLAVRRADREQPEHEFVSLSRTGSAALRHYFDEVVQSHRPLED